MIRKVVRITAVEAQDSIRRKDLQGLTPAQRVEALMRLRDQMFPGRLDKSAVRIHTRP
jgi:hypothetical protein